MILQIKFPLNSGQDDPRMRAFLHPPGGCSVTPTTSMVTGILSWDLATRRAAVWLKFWFNRCKERGLVLGEGETGGSG